MSASIAAARVAEAGYNYIGRPYSEMDCQAFVERCLKDCGIDLNLPGSNAWYRKMTWVGSPEDCKARYGSIPVGAFLFILKDDGGEPAKYKPDGIGNASHIGIYTGRGQGAINSSSTRGCVCESKFSGKSIRGGWNRVGLWDRLSYGEAFDRMFTGIMDSSSPAIDRGEIGGMYTATVYAQSGSTVNMRSAPDKSGELITRVPVGAAVDVYDDFDDPNWCKVSFGGRTGYMMSEFLIPGVVKPGDGSGTSDLVTIDRAQLRSIYDKLGDMLGLRG